MSESIFSRVPAGLGEALIARGFTSLTEIQQAVVDAEVDGRDVRMSSQTGSGKTVALGLVVAGDVERAMAAPRDASQAARPAVVMVAPTRELATQLADELAWLFQPLGARIGSLTGGRPLEGDFRMLRANPPVLVGTPGRIVDHLRRGTLSFDGVAAVALDEADEMLDMGFEEEVGAILEGMPPTRRTHLLSATFPRAVQAIAARYQNDPVLLTGLTPGEANLDISHHAMTVYRHERLAALINILLMDPERKTLVFVRTRADASELAEILVNNGFTARALSGELSQRERTATLSAFRVGGIAVLVATDVAARGLDVHDIAQVVHADLPENSEVLTHRSGRTGRAGRKGLSILFMPPRSSGRVQDMLRRAGIRAERVGVPTAEDIHAAADARLLASLAGEKDRPEDAGHRFRGLAEKLLAAHDPLTLVTLLLERGDHAGPCAPRNVRRDAPKGERPTTSARPPRGGDGEWVRFQVSWGSYQGADPRRMLALLCRRGGVDSGSIGAIKIGERSSSVDVAAAAAESFAKATARPDARDPRIKIRRWQDQRPAAPHPGARRSESEGDDTRHARTAAHKDDAPDAKPRARGEHGPAGKDRVRKEDARDGKPRIRKKDAGGSKARARKEDVRPGKPKARKDKPRKDKARKSKARPAAKG